MSYETPHKKYLNLVKITSGLSGKRVLEVGGSTPPSIVRAYAPAGWESVNLDREAVENFNKQAQCLGISAYSAVCSDIATVEKADAYDLVYSINAFEHIHHLDVALNQMFRALKKGGHLFTLFGPIWSSDVGHHLSICTDDGRELHFLQGILAPWEHLTSTRGAIYVKLAALYGEKTAQRAVTYIYDYADLNRLVEREYLEIVKKSGFSRVLVMRNRQGRAPNIPGATNTREFLMILKKGSVTRFQKGACFTKFALEYGRQEIAKRLQHLV